MNKVLENMKIMFRYFDSNGIKNGQVGVEIYDMLTAKGFVISHPAIDNPAKPSSSSLGEQVEVPSAQVAPEPITLRQHYAAAAIASIVGAVPILKFGEETVKGMIAKAFIIADQMIEYEASQK